MKTLVIWFNPHKNFYYYKIVKNLKWFYKVGHVNNYGHIVILVIDIYKDIFYKEPLSKKVLNKIICFLQNISKKL